MAAKNKTYIQDAVVSRFTLDALMVAREILHTHCSPKEKYAYRGPNRVVNVRDRSIHAFDGIYTKCVELDALKKMPVIACPSDDLGMLLSFNNDPVIVDSRFSKIESEIAELKRTFHRYTEVITSSNPFPTIEQAALIQPTIPPSIPPSTRRRLVSQSNKRMRTDEGVPNVEHSESEDSMNETEDESAFQLPRDQAKKLARRAYSDRLKAAPPTGTIAKQPSNKKPNRLPATWGKANAQSTNHLRGSPPQIFMFNCRLEIEEENVKDHFKATHIELSKVCKMTKHAEARTHSFCITVSSPEDYDKIMTGDFTPSYVGVRRFIPARRVNNQNTNATSKVINDFLTEPDPTFTQSNTVDMSEPTKNQNGS